MIADPFLEDPAEAPPTIHEFADRGRAKLAHAQSGVAEVLSEVSTYARANPSIAMAGAAVVGGLVVAIAKAFGKPPSQTDVIRTWLEEEYAKLPG